MEQYLQTAELLCGVIVFITFFYSNMNEEYNRLLATEKIQGNTEEMGRRKRETLMFVCTKWIPLVILPALFL